MTHTLQRLRIELELIFSTENTKDRRSKMFWDVTLHDRHHQSLHQLPRHELLLGQDVPAHRRLWLGHDALRRPLPATRAQVYGHNPALRLLRLGLLRSRPNRFHRGVLPHCNHWGACSEWTSQRHDFSYTHQFPFIRDSVDFRLVCPKILPHYMAVS